MHLELVIVDGPQSGRRFTLGRNPVTFGRSVGATNTFPQDSFMSGMHLSVQYALSCLIVLDLRSSNGTFLNGQRITQSLAVPGDVIKIGTLTLQVVIGKPPSPSPDPVEPEVLPEPPAPAPLVGATTVMAAVTEPMPAVTEDAVVDKFEPDALEFEDPAFEEPAIDAFQQIEKPVIEEVLAPQAEPVGKVHESVLTWLEGTAHPLFCLIDPGVHVTVPSLLEQASERMESLHDGGADNILARFAPHVVQLGLGSPLLRELVENGWGQGWACFFTSDASLEELAAHFRKFFMVQLEGGKEIYFRFYDPTVLRGFLPAGSAEELTVFFGPVVEWMIEAKNSAMMLKITNDSRGLHTMTIPLAVTATRFRKSSAK